MLIVGMIFRTPCTWVRFVRGRPSASNRLDSGSTVPFGEYLRTNDWNDRLCSACSRLRVKKKPPIISPLWPSIGGSWWKIEHDHIWNDKRRFGCLPLTHSQNVIRTKCVYSRPNGSSDGEKIRYHNLWIVRCYCFGFCTYSVSSSFASQFTIVRNEYCSCCMYCMDSYRWWSLLVPWLSCILWISSLSVISTRYYLHLHAFFRLTRAICIRARCKPSASFISILVPVSRPSSWCQSSFVSVHEWFMNL